MVTRTYRTTIISAAWAALVVTGGCAQSFTAREYPAFYDPNLRTVAVVPFQNRTHTAGAGLMAAEDLAAALQVNGTYSVIRPHRLRSLLREKKLPELSRTDYAKDAEVLRQLGSVQAFIMGRVLRDPGMAQTYPAVYGHSGGLVRKGVFRGPVRYELVDEEGEEGEEGEEDEGFGEGFGDEFGESFGDEFGDDFYGPGYPYWYWNYPYYYPEYVAEARVALEVSMVRVSDGAVLYTTPVPVWGRADLASYRRIAPGSATLDAIHHAVARLINDLAAVPVKVKVRERLDIRTAAGKIDGQWDFRNTFSPTDEQMYVVVQLPSTVGRNSFELTITPKKEPGEVAAARRFVWPPGADMDAVRFSPKKIAAHTGPGEYSLNLYTRDQRVMRHDFKIE
ncbi:MAG: CsgG/HfaB family protein [Planctomycetes bacterium]|nr:CsgG/HfaB family protein [Planctomycetota bacterium]